MEPRSRQNLTTKGKGRLMRGSVLQREKGLTDLQERFCQEYLIDLNAAQVYMRTCPDVSASVATTNGGRLLRYAHIQARIQELAKVIAQETKLTAVNVLRELATLVFSRITEVIEWTKDGNAIIKASSEIPQDILPAIKKIKKYRKNLGTAEEPDWIDIFEIELHDKVKAINLAMQHLRLLGDEGSEDKKDISQLILGAQARLQKFGWDPSMITGELPAHILSPEPAKDEKQDPVAD